MHLIYQLNQRLKKIQHSFGGALQGQIAILGLTFAILMLLHIFAMVLFEGLSFGDATWLTITTATTVGYGDISATTSAGRLATVLLMYLGGIFVLAQLAGLVFEATAEKREKRLQGKLAILTQNHIVIFGWREQYIADVVAQVRASMAPLHDADIIVVSDNMTTLPNHLLEQRVRHVVGSYFETATFDRAALQRAAAVVVTPEQDETADFTTLDLVERLVRYGVDAPIVTELHNIEYTDYARGLGANHVQLFNPSYPDMLARSILAPGAEVLMEEITKNAKTEMLVLHLPIEETVGQIRKAVRGVATLLGFQSSDSTYEINPIADTSVKDNPLIFLVDTKRFISTSNARRAIKQRLEPLTAARTIKEFSPPDKVGVIGAAERVTAGYLMALRTELAEEAVVELLCNDCWRQPLSAAELSGYDAVVVLADDPLQPQSDAKSFAAIHLIRQILAFNGRLITEAVLPANQTRFTEAGANDVIRPVTNNMEILARCILTGAEEVLDNLFNSSGHELLKLTAEGQLTWQQLTDRLSPLGLPLGYEDDEKRVEVLPVPDQACSFSALFLIVRRSEYTKFEVLERAVQQALLK